MTDFLRICMDTDIREEWFGIANGLNLFINNRVMALDSYKNVFSPQYLQIKWMNLIKFCIWIDKYKIHVVSNACYIWSILTELWPLIDVRILFKLNILWINLWIMIKFCTYLNDPKFSDRYANSADPVQRGAVWSGSTQFAIPSALFGLITLW